MKKYVYIAIFLTLMVGTFFAGSQWGKLTIAALPAYELTEPIKLQTSPQRIGELPVGSMMYEYRPMGETITYIVFVNLKDRTIIEPVEFERFATVSPVSGYKEYFD